MNHLTASPRSALDPCLGPARPPLASVGSSPSSSPAASPYARRASPSSSSIPPASIARSSAASPPSGLGTRSLRRSLLASSSSSLLALSSSLPLPPRTRAVDDAPLAAAFDGWTPHVSNTRSPVANCSSSRAAIDSSVGTSSFKSFSSPFRAPSFPPSIEAFFAPSQSRGNFMCASHLRSGKDLARVACRHSPVFASTLYIGRSRHA
mmetsp:Transcript_5598/g.23037  ORF Transcript_5598/g.23037 Transcript_5598/m.23037 type:complete len:207 (+) Transcript_5598:400-1020(+)